MNFKVVIGTIFKKQVKRLIKKYPSIKEEIYNISQRLKENPKLGTHIKKNCYKIRIYINSKGRGKSGGARIITHLILSKNLAYLISIYDKSEKDSISNEELNELVNKIES